MSLIVKILTFPFRALWWVFTLPFRLAGRLLRNTPVYRFFTDEPEELPDMVDVFETVVSPESGIVEHLEQLRGHLFRSLIALVLFVVLSFTFLPQLAELLAGPLGGLEKLQSIGVTEQLNVLMRISLLSGLALALPYITFEIWLFVAPGIRPRSRLLSLAVIPIALFLFLGGVAFAYFAMLPIALPVLLSLLPGIQSNPTATDYFEFVTNLLLGVGGMFEFPLVIFALALMGLIRPQVLLQHWRIAIMVIAVIAAMLTPTTDPVNMGLLMLPMTVLYFLSVFFSWLAHLIRKNDDPNKASRAG